MIRRQDRNNLTRGKSTLAKAPMSLTHQACTPLDTEVRILEWTTVDKWELRIGWKRVPDTSLGPDPVRKGIWQAEGAE